jgi:hypothetical protein
MSDSRLVHLLGATGKSRVETFDGREHLVVPVVALIANNVIHAVNAPTAEFVPVSALSAQGWDGRPLVLGHPTENGRQISANDPAVLERQGFGFLAKTRLAGARLGTEAWCDVGKLERLGQQKMLAALREGLPIEVSVGAFVQTRDKSGTHNGKQYAAEWATTSPDHLAFLPDGRGACSVEMGCGSGRMAMRVMAGSDELQMIGLRDIPQSERDKMDSSDFAGPDESFPIKTQADVDAAKRLVGKAANPDAVKAKIIAIAKRKGLTIPDAWKERNMSALDKLKSRVMALFDTPEEAASEEAAELIAYKSMRIMFDAVETQWKEASDLIDALISDEEDDPTETRQQEDAEEEVEDARLDAIRMLCYSISASLNNVCSVTYKLQTPDAPEPSDPRYMESMKTLVGKAISAKNLKVIQAAHDASHDTHSSTVALGAQCNGMKLLEAAEQGDSIIRAACGCNGDVNMTATERAAALKAIADIKDAGFTSEELKGLQLLSDKSVNTLHTLAGKTPADAIIQAKYAADAALAGHAHGLNAQEAAAAAKAAAKEEPKAAEVKAAEAKTPEQEQAEFYAKHPEIKTLVDRQQQQEKVRHAELVSSLKSCGALSEEQLKAKTLEDLETLAQFARIPKPDFSGRAMPRTAESGDVYANPPDPYAEGLKAMRGKTVN